MGDPNFPPGTRQNDIDGPQCPQCGQHGCDCEPDGDPRSYRERIEDEKGEHKADLEREDAAQ